jgi:hypothetical protein
MNITARVAAASQKPYVSKCSRQISHAAADLQRDMQRASQQSLFMIQQHWMLVLIPKFLFGIDT